MQPYEMHKVDFLQVRCVFAINETCALYTLFSTSSSNPFWRNSLNLDKQSLAVPAAVNNRTMLSVTNSFP